MTEDFDDKDFDKLKNAFDDAPKPSDDAKKRALMTAMQAFEKNTQENAKPARPTLESATIMSRLKVGVQKMMTSKQWLYRGTAIAGVAAAAFIFQSNMRPSDMDKNFEPAVPVAVKPVAAAAPNSAPVAAVIDQGLVDNLVASADEASVDFEISADKFSTMTLDSSVARLSANAIAIETGALSYEAPIDHFEPYVDALQPTVEGAEVNPLKITAQEPVSTFSIDVDTASYARVRQMIELGQLPHPDMVRTEEMINYFPYDYVAPKGDQPFATHVSVVDTPWNKGTKLVHIGIQGKKIAPADRAPLDLVFLIDSSGSMDDPSKLPMLKSSFKMMLSQLRADDNVSIVTYAGNAGVVLEPTSASEKAKIMAALDNLYASGGTNGVAGIVLAYQLAAHSKGDGRTRQVMLATDGDFNIGIDDPDALQAFIEKKRDEGVYLSVLGFGMGGNDAIMQRLAQNGNGQAYYIDGLLEARKALVDELTGAIAPIANDVKIQVEFNPAVVAEYRLIGYETRGLAREDFNNDKVDAGEIGAGHQVTAIYEITPVGSDAVRNYDLRYQNDVVKATSGEIGFIKLRYKTPGESESQLTEQAISENSNTSGDLNFSIAMAGFAELLRGDKYIGDWSISDAIILAEKSKRDDVGGYRTEAIGLMKIAETIK